MSLKKIIDLDLLDRFLAKVKELIPTKTSDLVNDSRYMVGMTILSYGKSTWDDFIDAYGDNKVVYCRASSNSNPASGSQTRMAFMAYVNNQTTPTEVEFQYYRSVNAHTDSQQGDQVYVYKLNKNAGWTVIVRNAFSKVAIGTGLTHTYSNGTITINNSEVVPGVVSTTADGLAPQLPNESTTTKFLRQDATWAVPPDTTYESKAAASGGTDVSLVTTGEKYIWNTKELPSGGSAGQVLKKSSATDYSVEWGDAGSGGSMLVTFTQVGSSSSYTADKTFAEVYAAIQSGVDVRGKYLYSGAVYYVSSYSSTTINFSNGSINDGNGGAYQDTYSFKSDNTVTWSRKTITIPTVSEPVWLCKASDYETEGDKIKVALDLHGSIDGLINEYGEVGASAILSAEVFDSGDVLDNHREMYDLVDLYTTVEYDEEFWQSDRGRAHLTFRHVDFTAGAIVVKTIKTDPWMYGSELWYGYYTEETIPLSGS